METPGCRTGPNRGRTTISTTSIPTDSAIVGVIGPRPRPVERATATGASPSRPEPARAVLERARDGCVAAFGEIVRMLERRLYSFHLRRVGRAEDAADLTQETFLRAWRSMHRYDPERRFTTWLFTIATRTAIDHLRQAGRRETESDRLDTHVAARNDARTTQSEEAAKLWALAQETLSPDQRTAIWLRYAEDLGIDDIARVLGRTRLATRVLLCRARQRLAARAETAGHDQTNRYNSAEACP